MNGGNTTWSNVLKMNTPTIVALAAILITMFSLKADINSLKADIRELRQDTDRKLERIDARLDSFGERFTANKTRLDTLDEPVLP